MPDGDPAERLQRLWDEGRPPDLGAFLARAGPLSPQQVAVLLRIDQRGRWRAGEPVPAEDYLGRHPAVAADPDLAVDLVFNEFLLRERRGERPGPDEYARRFPQYAAVLRPQIELHGALASDTVAWDGAPRRPAAEAETLAPAAPAPPESAWPAVPGYEILDELGRGGMGVVFRARQTSLNRTIALKMLLAGRLASSAEARRFRAEAEAAARLQHPNVVQIHEVGENQGQPYLALEYVEGGSLADRLRGAPQPPRWAAELVETLARAVQAAHARGVVHRDLKPANVLLTADGTPKIADFGLAKRLDAQTAATQTGAVLGTPAYMAPEQAGGKAREVGPAADVWALGALLYECLTGRPPFTGPTPTDTLLRVLSEEPAPPRKLNPAAPRDLETIALKCLRKEPQKRYGSAGELADDLRRFLQGQAIRARPLSLAERLWRRRRWLAAGLALLAVVLLGAGTLALLGWRERRDKAFGEARARGLQQLESQKVTDAVASFTEALAIHPDSPGLLTERGTAYGMLGDGDRALADFAEALRLDPGNALAYRRRGWLVLYKLRRPEEALTDLTRSLDLDPQQGLSWRIRAEAYMTLGRWPEAANDLSAAARLEPDDLEVHHRLGVLHAAQGRWDDAAREYERSRPTMANYLFARAAADLLKGDEDDYRQDRDRLVALVKAVGSNDMVAAVLAARACALPEKAAIDPTILNLLEDAVKELPDNPLGQRRPPDVWYGILFRRRVQAQVWLRTGRAEDAVRQIEDNVKAEADYSPAIDQLLLCIAHQQLGDPQEAGRALERALREPVPVSHVHETLEYQVLLREARKGRGQP